MAIALAMFRGITPHGYPNPSSFLYASKLFLISSQGVSIREILYHIRCSEEEVGKSGRMDVPTAIAIRMRRPVNRAPYQDADRRESVLRKLGPVVGRADAPPGNPRTAAHARSRRGETRNGIAELNRAHLFANRAEIRLFADDSGSEPQIRGKQATT